jgi:NAD+-dependent secondary alcohol dehydrogenase Adh1
VLGDRRTRRAGPYFAIGYGGTVPSPTLDIISTGRTIVGTYHELAELMALAQAGQVTLHTADGGSPDHAVQRHDRVDRPHVAGQPTFPLADAARAPADLDAGRVRGRAIVIP